MSNDCQKYHEATGNLDTVTPEDMEDGSVLEVIEHWTRTGPPRIEGNVELRAIEYVLAINGPKQVLIVDRQHLSMVTWWGGNRCESSISTPDLWLDLLDAVEDVDMVLDGRGDHRRLLVRS